MSRINLNLTPQMLANLATQAAPTATASAEPAATSTQTTTSATGGPDSYENPDLAVQQRIRGDFRNRFAALAQDRNRFHAFFAKVYGSHDTGAAERLRRQTLAGDMSWLPKIQFVPRAQLQGANGAYSAQKGTVYLAGDLRNNPSLAARTFSEEVGHHIDTKVKASDTPGDEGELFRRLLHGERLSGAQIAAIKNENDHGVVNINGENVQVEFFLKKIKKSFKRITKKIGNTVKRTINTVTKPIRKGVRAVTNVARKVTRGVMNVAKKVTGKAVSLVRGAVRGVTNIAKKAFRAVTGLIKRPLSAMLGLAKRLFDIGSGLGQRIFGSIFSNVFGHVFDRFWSLAGRMLR